MTVAELIDTLQKLPLDAVVIGAIEGDRELEAAISVQDWSEGDEFVYLSVWF